MTTQSKQKSKDNSFSSFAVGVSVGVAAAFLFGTEEGRNLVKKVVDAIPEKYKKVPEPLKKVIDNVQPVSQSFSPIIQTQETPHHATYNYSENSNFRDETPPPAPPAVRPTRPELFHES